MEHALLGEATIPRIGWIGMFGCFFRWNESLYCMHAPFLWTRLWIGCGSAVDPAVDPPVDGPARVDPPHGEPLWRAAFFLFGSERAPPFGPSGLPALPGAVVHGDSQFHTVIHALHTLT